MTTRARGFTLVELLVALTLLGLLAGLGGLALRSATDHVSPSAADRIAGARREAIAGGHMVALTLPDSLGGATALALPDGRVLLSDPELARDVIGGRHATR